MSPALPASTPRRRLRVFARPAWRCSNPYTGLLADALVAQGLEVLELNMSWGQLPSRKDIILFHWPDEFFVTRGAAKRRKAIRLLVKLAWYKVSARQKIVWVAHNLTPHDGPGRRFPLATRAFFALLDGMIFLSHRSRDAVVAAFPTLAKLPHVVVTHGHYRSLAQRPPSLPRPAADRPVRVGNVGHVKRYKSIERLARLAAALGKDRVEVVVAGACRDAGLEEELRSIAGTSGNIELRLKYHSQTEIEALFEDLDGVILSHRDMLNSGSALLALSRSRPVVAPRLGSLVELQEQVGRDWLWLYDGALSEERLAEAVEWLAGTDRPAHPDLSAHEWDRIGVSAAGFFRKLANP